MLRNLVILVLLVYPVILPAQTKLLTVEDATYMNPKLNAANLSQLQWYPKSSKFVYVAKNSLVQGTPAKPGRDTLVRLRELNELLRYNKFDTLKRFPSITFLTPSLFYYINGNKIFHCDILSNTVIPKNSWPDKAENTDIDESGEMVAYTIDNNLFISENGKEITISHEQNPGILFGSSRVHRNEFGIEKGTFWSPDRQNLAFYRMDETMVTDYPLVDASQRIAKVNPTKYPMAGMASHRVTVGVYTLKTGKIIYMQTDFPGFADTSLRIEYLTNITWSPDSKTIYIATLNRDQNFMQLNAYDATTGMLVKTLFEEKNDTYVEPLHGPRFLKGHPDNFVWESRHDGYNHLYLYDTGGKLIRQLTKGPWEVTEYLCSDETGSKVFFQCNINSPIDRHVAMVDIKTGVMTLLTKTDGVHAAKISDDGKFLIDTYSNSTIARQIELTDTKGTVLQTLLTNENPLKDYQLGTTTIFTLKSEDNSDLYCRLIKPVNFDPAKKYPVIIYVYGGPHSQLITNSWLGGAGLFLNYLADLGYVVFTLDNRGTSNRGRAFEQAIFRNLGTKEVNDQMVGVRYLKALDFVDSTRIGINGWSYGGFMTISMFLKHPESFKVAVCGGPVIDWQYYEVMYGERYMDTPQSNPEGYRNACLLNYVGSLNGKLLIIHDDQDNTVVPQNSISFLKKCVDQGKQVDFFLYPGHEHNVRGKDRVHLNQKMADYFKANL